MNTITATISPEQRIEPRTETRIPIVGSAILEGPVGRVRPYCLEGLTANVSASGACIYLCHKIEKGLVFTISGKPFGNVPRYACIRWCERIDEGIFRVGVSLS